MSNHDKEVEKMVFVPKVDVIEGKNNFTLRADLPGVVSEDVDVNLTGDLLTIAAKVKEYEARGLPMLYGEFVTGDYEVSFKVSNKVDKEKIEAELKDGVLTLTMPKAAEVKPRQIKVKAA